MTRSGLLTRTARSPATTSAAGVFGMRPRLAASDWPHGPATAAGRRGESTLVRRRLRPARDGCAARARVVVGARSASAVPLRTPYAGTGTGDRPRGSCGGLLRALQRGRLVRPPRARPVRLRAPLRGHLGPPWSLGPHDEEAAAGRVVAGRDRGVPGRMEHGARLRRGVAAGRAPPPLLPDPGVPPRRRPGRRRRHAPG